MLRLHFHRISFLVFLGVALLKWEIWHTLTLTNSLKTECPIMGNKRHDLTTNMTVTLIHISALRKFCYHFI